MVFDSVRNVNVRGARSLLAFLWVVLATDSCSGGGSEAGETMAVTGATTAGMTGESSAGRASALKPFAGAASDSGAGARAMENRGAASGQTGSTMPGQATATTTTTTAARSNSSAGAPSANAGGTIAAGAGGAAPTSTMSAGCGKEPAAAGTVNLEVDGMARLYIVDLPAGYDKSRAYRLIMAFHGAGLAAKSFKNFFKLTAAVGDEAIVAYLEALGDPTGWDYKRDMPYFDAVLSQLKTQFCIDESRLFATGHSSGGYFSNALGCQRGDVLRAIGPFSGGAAFKSNCKDKVAAWISHGNKDDIVPTNEGRAARDLWASQYGCDKAQSMPIDPAPCVAYAGCDTNNPVHYCEYDGDHNLPSFGVQAVWSFFKAL